jgi:spore maturation protein CgeB
MYEDLEAAVRRHDAKGLIVDNCFPYHPEFLRSLPVYKVLRTSDGPLTAYDRDFAYLHAYDHVLYHSPAYSRDLGMAEKLAYCGASAADFLPLGLFDAAYDGTKTEETLFAGERDIDIIFIGALFVNKMPLLAQVRKAFGRRFRIYGLANLKKNVYFNFRHGFPGWVRPAAFEEYVPLYQRSKIGINVHNRGDYTVGSFRLFDLPGNGVMQISDGGEHLDAFFRTGEEIDGYRDGADLVEKLRYYLAHDEERTRIARNGHRRVIREYRFGAVLRRAGELIRAGMQRRGTAAGR